MIKPQMMLWLAEARGIYIPRDFAESFNDRAASVAGVTDEQWAVLEAGPDHEHYWDVWMEVCDNAIVTDKCNVQYRVEQNGDCWLVPIGMIWNDEKDTYEWPECPNYENQTCGPECAKYCARDIEKPEYCWANFCKMVFYGRAGWHHNSEWIVPGTITNEEMV